MHKGGQGKGGGAEFTADPNAERTQLLLGTPSQSATSTGGSGYSGGQSKYKELNEEERLRLLLVEGKKESRGVRVSHGVAKLLGKWPTYVASAIWGVIFIISLITLLSLLTFILLMKNQKSDQWDGSIRLNNEFCRRVTSANRSLLETGYVNGRADSELSVLEASNIIFFLETKSINKDGACSLESVLRLCPDKSVFVLDLGGKRNIESADEAKLRAEYTNLHTLKTGGAEYLTGSPFEGLWTTTGADGKSTDFALTAVKILTVWQFGGAVISDNLLMYSRRMFDQNEGYCEVDRDLLFCPDQCSAFVYDMMVTAVTSKGVTGEDLVERALQNFCGGGNKYVKTGCVGINRLKPYSMCDTEGKHCIFIRIDEFKSKNTDWPTTMKKYCPIVMK